MVPRKAIRGGGLALALLALAPAAALGAVGDVWTDGPGRDRYVAMGDSAASGPIIPNQRHDPAPCLRSDRNFPSVVAARLKVKAFRDVTCSSAQIKHLRKPQVNPNNLVGVNPPQFDALERRTTLVTIGPIGANDFSLVGVGLQCINPLPPIGRTSCRERFQTGGVDRNIQVIEKLGRKFDRMLKTIHRKAPRADVFVVGYGYYLPAGGCWPYVPIWPGDAAYIQDLVNRLNTELFKTARRGKATYVNLQGRGAVDHTMCAPFGKQWITQLTDPLPGGAGLLAHPTARGMEAMGRMVVERIKRTRARHGR